uniref:Uncharacterized protein n=1 Tax=Romanomermis culicivorax TaxID=13658 RepID=A0A915ID35_ROMCU
AAPNAHLIFKYNIGEPSGSPVAILEHAAQLFDRFSSVFHLLFVQFSPVFRQISPIFSRFLDQFSRFFGAVFASAFSNDGHITYNHCRDAADVSNVNIVDVGNDCLI